VGDDDCVLQIMMHHTIGDAWSTAILMRELDTLYRCVRGRVPSPLSPLRVQYRDYVDWQRSPEQGAARAAQLEYWRTQLAGAPALSSLPADRARPAVRAYQGGTYAFTIEADLADRVREVAKSRGMTPFMILLSAFQALLSRHSGSDDVTVATVVAGRVRIEWEDLIGFFVNQIPLRLDCSGDPTVDVLWSRARTMTLDALANQDAPFDQIVEVARPARDPSHQPLCQTLFVLQNAPTHSMRVDDVMVTVESTPTESSRMDLAMYLSDASPGEPMDAIAVYDAALFDAGTIETAVRHFVRLLDGMTAMPASRLSDIPLVDGSERRHLLSLHVGARRGDDDRASVVRMFADHVARSPDAPAIVDGHTSWSYAELHKRSIGLALELRRLGLGREGRVGLSLERGAPAIAAMLGVLAAGGAYVPLDPHLPPERLNFLVRDASIRFVITTDWCRETTSSRGFEMNRVLFGDLDTGVDGAAECELPKSAGDDLAYVMYTSGSTGKPKGVLIQHGQLASYTRSFTERIAIRRGSNVTFVAPLTFDSSVSSIYGALCTGCCLHIVSEALALDGHQLGTYFVEHAIDVLKITPRHLAALLDCLMPSRLIPRATLVLGGEGAAPAWVDDVQALRPECRIFNHYGPTEATVGVTMHECRRERADTVSRATLPLGTPLADTALYVLDAAMAPVPIGVSGEVYIGGSLVARGYLDRPALTAERYVPDPFRACSGTRLYRTGDRGRIGRDGLIECLGRADDQVKIRGMRVELAEVETALRELDGVENAIVVKRDEPGGSRLVAYVTPRPTATIDSASLRLGLRTKLLDFMIPAAVVVLPLLPLTTSGKLDRRALPDPGPDEQGTSDGRVAPLGPRTATEARLATIWCDVLGKPSVGVSDDFFEIGGHSLLAAQLITRARRAFAREIPLRSVFVDRTIASMALTIDALERGAEVLPALTAIPRAVR
jgi:amino acid adenylation domain-containing protein